MAIKSKEYQKYVEKTADHRIDIIKQWKSDISLTEDEYRELATIYLDYQEVREKFPKLQSNKALFFYFSRYDFKLTAKYIETINDIELKLTFLLEIKTEFEHDIDTIKSLQVFDTSIYLNFGKRCQIEINKLKDLQELALRKREIELLELRENKNKNDWDYFRFERVKTHISEMTSFQAQLEYLVNIKAEYIQGSDYSPPLVKGEREFNELCDSEIVRIKELNSLQELIEIPRTLEQMEKKTRTTSNDNIPKKNPLTTRQAVIFLLALMYGKPQVDGTVNKTDISDFIETLKAIDVSNVYEYVRNPLSTTPESTKERKSRIRDLNVVKNQLKDFRINQGRWKGIDDEINLLQQEIDNIHLMIKDDEKDKW